MDWTLSGNWGTVSAPKDNTRSLRDILAEELYQAHKGLLICHGNAAGHDGYNVPTTVDQRCVLY